MKAVASCDHLWAQAPARAFFAHGATSRDALFVAQEVQNDTTAKWPRGLQVEFGEGRGGGASSAARWVRRRSAGRGGGYPAPDKLLVDVFELAEFTPNGSQNRSKWLPRLDDVRTGLLAVL